MDKYLSIITNFGCHYTCPYCIVKENNLDIPVTTIDGLNNIQNAIKETGANIISLSGGGDPLFHFSEHKDWYKKLYELTTLPLEMHTSYVVPPLDFPFRRYKRIVYHIRDFNDLNMIRKHGNEIIRVVFVVTKDFTKNYVRKISDFVKKSDVIDELSFRQMIDTNYNTTMYLHKYLKNGHKKDWYYIEQNDYNVYYVENNLYYKYKNIGGK